MKVVVFLLALLLTAGSAGAQSLTAGSTPAAAQNGIRQQGAYITAPITLDGDYLLTIAAPALAQPGQASIAVRQTAVQNALAQVVAVVKTGGSATTLYSPYSLRVLRTQMGPQAVLQAVDAAHSTPLTLLTVTPVDAKFHGTTTASLAATWQPVLRDALKAALLKRQPSVEQRNRRKAITAAGALAGFTLVAVGLLLVPLRRRIKKIERRLKERGERLEEAQSAPSTEQSATHEGRRHFLALAVRVTDPKREAAMLHAFVAALIWLLVLLWFAAIEWGLFLFPQTTPIAHELVRTLLTICAIWIGTGLLNRILDLIIGRLGSVWRGRQFRSSEERTRELLRIPTITAAMSGFKTILLFFVALLITLGRLGIPVWSVVTFGGLTAIGITLAAQNFVRDFVNGFLVLFEDQYVVGDFITINAQSGIVENLTLRIAQIRDMAGNLVTIPHSTVTSVVNHSRNWSRVDYRVSVDPQADVGKAIELVSESIRDVTGQQQWGRAVLEPIEWIGVDALSRDGVVIRAAMKTAPLRQFELRRAINERVQARFKEAGIAFGAPVAEALY